MLTVRLRKWKSAGHQGNLQKQRGKFQSQQLSLLTHFNLGEPDVRLPTHDFVGRCKGWSVLETDVRLFFFPPVPLSVIWKPSTSRAAFITALLYLGSAQLEFTTTPLLLRLYLKTCTWLRMENKLVTCWREMRNPAGSQQTHLEAKTAFLFFIFFGKQSLYSFWKTRDVLLIFNLHNPFVITRLIFTSGLS